jgi:hypothetical protein
LSIEDRETVLQGDGESHEEEEGKGEEESSS